MTYSTKKAIRERIIQERDSIPKNIKEAKDAAIMEHILSLHEFSDAKTIFLYASFRSEVNTTDLIIISLDRGKMIVLPKVEKENRRLKLYVLDNMNELVTGHMGIPEPAASEDRLRTLDDIELIIIPGIAFDEYGNRLGYGAGFYDRLLSETKRRIPVFAPAYEEQIVEKIPAEPHDIKVDKIITDKRIINISL